MAARQYAERDKYQGSYNIGPDDCDCVTTGDLADLFCISWGDGAKWINKSEANAPHEANFLKLDCAKIKRTIGWQARWHIADAVAKTVEWSKAWLNGEDMNAVTDAQIKEFLNIQ